MGLVQIVVPSPATERAVVHKSVTRLVDQIYFTTTTPTAQCQDHITITVQDRGRSVGVSGLKQDVLLRSGLHHLRINHQGTPPIPLLPPIPSPA